MQKCETLVCLETKILNFAEGNHDLKDPEFVRILGNRKMLRAKLNIMFLLTNSHLYGAH